MPARTAGAFRIRLLAHWDALRTSLWIVPGALALAGGASALAALRLPPSLAARPGLRWLDSGDGGDATMLLATLLTSVIAMAGTVLSITVVAFTLAASAQGPRLIRVLRSHRGTQLVLGLFLATIVHLLVVLRAVRGAMAATEVPHAAVSLGALMALACVVALLAFVQSAGRLIVSDEVVRRVRTELDTAIASLRELDGGEPDAPTAVGTPAGASLSLPLPREGYVQAIAYEALCDWARAQGHVVQLDVKPGDFVMEGDSLVTLWPPPADPGAAAHDLGRFFASGPERTPTQDPEFALRHLVEIALRALSAAINDPFTAIAVLDQLGAALGRLARRRFPDGVMTDADGQPRVFRRVTGHAEILAFAFSPIRLAAAGSPAVLTHLLEVIGRVATVSPAGAQRRALEQEARLVRRTAHAAMPRGPDRAAVDAAFDRALAATRG